MNIRCLRCKGRGYCGRVFCPHYAKAEARFKVQDKIGKQDFFGDAPSVFVGRIGYPNINVGILTPPERKQDAWVYDAPHYWAEKDFQLPQLIDIRSSLINSRFKTQVKSKNKFLDISQEVGMASKPVEVEINLEQKPKFKLNIPADVAPTGPNAKLMKAEITSNPKIDRKVDYVVSDYDFKANNAITSLYEKGYDDNFLTRLLSIGNLGVKVQRKLVPTRWSITATDDAISKHLLKQVKDKPTANYLAYFGSYLGNYYLILMFPEVWSYELFETYAPKTSWNVTPKVQFTTDYEPYQGRKTYANNCAGGYYATRLGILEQLKQMKRQASVLALRFITGEYAVPLGVWVVREAARKAMQSKPIEFASKELMLNYARLKIKKKFNFDLDQILKESILLKEMKQQSKLSSFI